MIDLKFTQKTENTYTADIYIAGDIVKIRDVCGEYCRKGFCVSIRPCEWVYTFGREVGAVVGIINYPRFPRSNEEIKSAALELAELLVDKCHQGTCSIVCTDETIFVSARGE